jgi:hypothetical protein
MKVSGELDAHWVGSWMDPRVGMDAVEKKKSLVSARN